MSNYTTIVFDLDGTLSNSGEGITKSVQYAIAKMGIEEDNLDNLKHFVGPPMVAQYMKTYDMTLEEAQETLKYYRERYTPIGLYETEIYPGVKELLSELKDEGYTLAVATSKPQEMAEEVLRYLEIFEYFDCIVGAQLHGPRQSKKKVLEFLFEKLGGVKLDEVLMVGDTFYDIQGANEVGIDSVGVSYGYGVVSEMKEAGAKAIVADVDELRTFIKGN